jgi:hypothetical protein
VRSQPNRNYVSNDDIQTPSALARRLVSHFDPSGHLLEPCAGDGNFLKALRAHIRTPNPSVSSFPHSTGMVRRTSRVSWCEVKRNRNFFAWDQKVEWIITNPPWSQVRRFLQHALSLADHVVFLFTINHLWTRARLGDIRAAGFAIREIVTFETPKNFPPMGFQLGAVCLSRGWTGPVTLTDYNMPPQPKDGGASARSSTLTCRLKRGKSGASQSALGLDPVLAELRALNRHLDALLEGVVKP